VFLLAELSYLHYRSTGGRKSVIIIIIIIHLYSIYSRANLTAQRSITKGARVEKNIKYIHTKKSKANNNNSNSIKTSAK
jgi:hypothetical protein